ncbi:MAG: hypothetical protein GY841_07795 [FCB group bacterium]|nr:hypothetical protein [FCB group bacterium]
MRTSPHRHESGRPVTIQSVLLYGILLWSIMVVAPGYTRAETATQLEMDQVCRNWLAQVVYSQGEWAGTASPEIISSGEIHSNDALSGGTLLARYYNISPNGFVIVPVLKEMTPIKAYSDESVLDERQEEGFISLLREMLTERLRIYTARYGSLDALQPASGEAVFGRGQKSNWDILTKPDEDFTANLATNAIRGIDEAGPLLTSSWHQRAPYNNLCPMGDGGRTVVGCVATATAQILNFWQWPPQGTGTYSYTWSGDQSCDGDVGGGVQFADLTNDYDWAHFIDSCDDGCLPADSAAMAELNYEVGVTFNMNYGACGSGASTARAVTVFPTYFKYKQATVLEYREDNTLGEWFGLIQEEIDNGRPIQYRINLHSIVCDGWREQSGQYEFHMNYGWGGSFTTWFVLDSLYCYWIDPDSLCPANEEFMITHIEPQIDPDISLISYSLTDGDGDGHAEAGEAGTFSVVVENLGREAVNTTGTLSSDDSYITITSASTAFDASIPSGAQSSSQTPFAFTISPSCPDPHLALFEMTLNATGGYVTTDSFLVFVGDTPGLTEDCESGAGFWTHKGVTSAYVDEWHLNDAHSVSGDFCWKAGGPGTADYADMSDGGLITPPFLLPWQAVLDFQQWLDVEIDPEPGMAWDGGIVMISIGGGEWEQITPVGGYPYSIVDNPASPFEPYTPCFSGTSGWNPVQFDLSAYSGAAQLMFRFGTDGAATQEGWYIDDIDVYGYICGDVNNDDAVNVGDAVFLINHVFKNGDAPDPEVIGDVNCDDAINVGDAVFLINYVFKGGDIPCIDCD